MHLWLWVHNILVAASDGGGRRQVLSYNNGHNFGFALILMLGNVVILLRERDFQPHLVGGIQKGYRKGYRKRLQLSVRVASRPRRSGEGWPHDAPSKARQIVQLPYSLKTSTFSWENIDEPKVNHEAEA